MAGGGLGFGSFFELGIVEEIWWILGLIWSLYTEVEDGGGDGGGGGDERSLPEAGRQ